METPKDQERKKGKGGKTVSSYFKGQLDDLMVTLYKTEPHFIRCVVPNTHKQPGGEREIASKPRHEIHIFNKNL